jgi:hypothetical protein
MCASRVDYRLSCKGHLPLHRPALAPLEQVRKEIHLEFAGARPAGSDGEDSVTPTISTSVCRTQKTPHGIFRLTIQNKKRT